MEDLYYINVTKLFCILYCCQVLEILCENILFLFSGYDGPQLNQTLLPAIASHTPAGTYLHLALRYRAFNAPLS